MSLSSEGIYFFYGDFNHRIGECYPRKIEIRPEFSRDGVRWASEHRMEIGGDLVAEDGGPLSKAQLKTRIEELDAAYSEDYKDCGWRRADNTLTPHVMLTNDLASLSGNQVIHKSWDNALPTELVNTRSFSVVIRNLFLNTYSPILSFRERVQQFGTGGPIWRKYNLWNGAPYKELLTFSSKVRYVQEGSVVGLTGYEALPEPWWPNDEQTWRRIITSTSPQFHGHPAFAKGTHYVKTYAYFFELSAAEFQNPSLWPN